MTDISENDLERVSGGGISPWTLVGVGAIVVFLIGVYDGYTRPLSCNR